MIKIAFIVEGQTERIFLESFLNAYFTHPDFDIESKQLTRNSTRIVTKRRYEPQALKFFFLILDVMGDSKVVSAIRERASGLIRQKGFNHIFGIRDVYPNKSSEIPMIESLFNRIFSNYPFSNKLTQILAVMEIEAWILAEYTVFERIDSSLTVDRINSELKISFDKDNIESYPHPAKTLQSIMEMAGRRYRKNLSGVHEICSRIDFAELCDGKNLSRIWRFKNFLQKLDRVTNISSSSG